MAPSRLELEPLSAYWQRALDAADKALWAATGSVPDDDLRERRQHLVQERQQTARLLEAVARVARPQPGPWLSPAPVRNTMLGLPEAVHACIFDLERVLTDSAAVHAWAWGEVFDDFFAQEFPDALPLIPDLAAQFLTHPQGMLGTVRCPRWHDGERLLLIGDAAHAIVPFHGQGMNCAFEDCGILDALLATDPSHAFTRFEADRRKDTDAIAVMALENYAEMRDAVRDPRFIRQKALAMALERAHPDRFIPRYSMVMFHDEIPYSTALERGRIQQAILDELTATEAVPDLQEAARQINDRLSPLSGAAR